MNGRDVCYRLEDAGLTVRADGERVILSPRERITNELRELVLANKPDLLAYLRWREAVEEVEASLPTPFRGSPTRQKSLGAGMAPQRPILGRSNSQARLGCSGRRDAVATRETQEEKQAYENSESQSVWIGLIRNAAGQSEWEPVVHANERMACWDALLRYPSPYLQTERRVDHV